MKRGVSQVLFNYTPHRTFDHDDGTICQVVGLGGERELSLDKTWVLQRVARMAALWGQRMRLPDPRGEADRFVLLKPTKVQYQTFPRLFYCLKHGCGVVRKFNTAEELERAERSGLRCRRCGGRLAQIPHVQIHNCGALRPLDVPRCDRCGHDGLVAFDDGGSRSYSRYRWVCRRCGTVVRPLLAANCDCGMGTSPRMTLTPHKAAQSYYPMTVTMLNVPGREVRELQEDPEWENLVLGTYLRRAIDPSSRLEPRRVRPGDDLDELIRSLSARGVDLSPEQLAALKASGEARGVREGDEVIRLGRSVEGLSAEDRRGVALELIEYLRLEDDLDVKQCRNPEIVGPLRLASISLVKNFPVTVATFGYTRVSNDPHETVLQPFPPVQGKTPIYVNTIETEALVFQLDPKAAYCWLRANGAIQEGTPAPRMREDDLRRWFLPRVTPPHDGLRLTASVWTLLHTMSHLVMKKVPLLTGFDTSSLGEYLLPHALAFAIYGKDRGSFSLGTFTTLFEQHLLTLAEVLRQDGGTCLFDPVCAEIHDGSCHVCTHVPETSCSEFNRSLSRHVLFGRSQPRLVGYWEERHDLPTGIG